MVVIGALLFWAMQYYLGDVTVPIFQTSVVPDVRHALWDFRRTDIFGQLAVLFVGIYGVIVLFKELKHDE
jgi:NADH-quinone oxidoreductase subunit J